MKRRHVSGTAIARLRDDPSVVDEYIEHTEIGGDLGHGSCDRVVLCDVELEQADTPRRFASFNLGEGFAALLGAAGGENNVVVRVCVGKRVGGVETNARVGS